MYYFTDAVNPSFIFTACIEQHYCSKSSKEQNTICHEKTVT